MQVLDIRKVRCESPDGRGDHRDAQRQRRVEGHSGQGQEGQTHHADRSAESDLFHDNESLHARLPHPRHTHRLCRYWLQDGHRYGGGLAQGYARTVQAVEDFRTAVHRPPHRRPDICIRRLGLVGTLHGEDSRLEQYRVPLRLATLLPPHHVGGGQDLLHALRLQGGAPLLHGRGCTFAERNLQVSAQLGIRSPI